MNKYVYVLTGARWQEESNIYGVYLYLNDAKIEGEKLLEYIYIAEIEQWPTNGGDCKDSICIDTNKRIWR